LNAGNVATVLDGVFAASYRASPPEPLLRQLLGVAAALGDRKVFGQVLDRVTELRQGKFATWQMSALAAVLDVLERRRQSCESLLGDAQQARVELLLTHARITAQESKATEPERLAAVGLLGRLSGRRGRDFDILAGLLAPQQPAAIQSAALAALGQIPVDR